MNLLTEYITLKQKEKEEGRELLEYKDLDSKTTKKRLP